MCTEIATEAANTFMFDWNLLITILAGLGGVMVGGFVTWKIQDRKLKHVDENRFQEQRMKVYMQMIDAGNKALAKYAQGKTADAHVEVEKFFNAYQQTQLISSSETYEKASDVFNAFRALQTNKKFIGSEKIPTEYSDSVKPFIRSARKELKIDTIIK